tara:strand:- start:128 stop:553 length:426 start_codon:yes stop_codon:yes gene_type:complete
MKHLLIIFSLLLTSVCWCELTEINNISLHNKLENYKWKKRIILLIVKEEDTVLVNQVNKFFITHKCKNDERNLELIKFKVGNSNHKKRTSNFKDKTGIWLIGYDGNIKAYTEGNALLLNLHDLIDNMPIRKEEMKEFKKNC